MRLVEWAPKPLRIASAIGLIVAAGACSQDTGHQRIEFPDCKKDPQTKVQSTTLVQNDKKKNIIEIDHITFWLSDQKPIRITVIPENRVRILRKNYHSFDGQTDGRTYDLEFGKLQQKDLSKEMSVTIIATCKTKQEA